MAIHFPSFFPISEDGTADCSWREPIWRLAWLGDGQTQAQQWQLFLTALLWLAFAWQFLLTILFSHISISPDALVCDLCQNAHHQKSLTEFWPIECSFNFGGTKKESGCSSWGQKLMLEAERKLHNTIVCFEVINKNLWSSFLLSICSFVCYFRNPRTHDQIRWLCLQKVNMSEKLHKNSTKINTSCCYVSYCLLW